MTRRAGSPGSRERARLARARAAAPERPTAEQAGPNGPEPSRTGSGRPGAASATRDAKSLRAADAGEKAATRPVPGGGAPILRRAVLADVPAAARLILQSEWCPQWDLPSPQALRLVLAHVALDAGELWVAEGAGELVASVVAVPPPTATPKAFGWSLRLELRPAERNAAASSGHALPEGHWLVLGSWNSGTTAVRSGLLRRALAAVDRRGLPAAAVGPQTDELRDAGFAESVGHQAPSCVLLRPAR